MNGREWKPGVVALVQGDAGEAPEVAIRTYDSRAGANVWWTGDGFWRDAAVLDVRPLVVIDPEDREQVERLRGLIATQPMTQNIADTALRAALREFVNPKPPKPAEPTGLGAVVEDADGDRWVHLSGRWHRNPLEHSRRYDEIDVVEVLAEGVHS